MNARIALCAGGVLLCATATVIVVGPRPLAGQTDRNGSHAAAGDYQVPPPVDAPHQPTRQSVQQVQYAAPAPPQAAAPQESETTRQLRLLYAKNGKEMPEMNIQNMPMVKHSPGLQNLRPVDPNEKPSSRFGFLGRLFSLGRDTTPPPRYAPPQYRQPVVQAPYVPQQPTVQQTPAARSIPAPQQRYAPQPVNAVPAANVSNARGVPASKNAADDDIPVLIDDRQDAAKSAPSQVAAQPKSRGPAANPFPDPSNSNANRNPPQAPRSNDGDPGPFTGKSLTDNDDEPKSKASVAAKLLPARSAYTPPARLEIKSHQQLQSEHLTQPHPLAEPKTLGTAAAGSKAVASQPSAREEKQRRIAARRGLTGFRGFCPVVLRDERELVDAKLQFQSEHRKKTYYFSSAAAKSTFDKAPEKYAPASSGIDVVLFNDDLKQVEGSLEHAVWFRGHLYFFTGSETLRKFVTEPKNYAIPE